MKKQDLIEIKEAKKKKAEEKKKRVLKMFKRKKIVNEK